MTATISGPSMSESCTLAASGDLNVRMLSILEAIFFKSISRSGRKVSTYVLAQQETYLQVVEDLLHTGFQFRTPTGYLECARVDGQMQSCLATTSQSKATSSSHFASIDLADSSHFPNCRVATAMELG